MDTEKFTRLIVFLKKWIVPICSGSVFVAVLFESYYTSPATTPIAFAVTAVLFLVMFYKKKQNIFLLLFICTLTISYALFRFHQEKEYRQKTIETLLSLESIDAPMQIISAIDYRENSTKAIARYNDARILVTLPKNIEIEYGDIVKINGKLTVPEPFETDTGRIFNYNGYLAKDRVFFEIRYPSYVVIEKGDSSFVLRVLYEFKDRIRKSIIDSHSKNVRGLLLGILIGERGGISKELQDSFVKTGTIHIVALSGYNVTIISEAIAYVLIPLLGFTFGIIGGAIAVVLFAIMTGLGATIVRATIMGLLAYLSRMTGKEFDIGRALLIAGSLMVLNNPWVLVYDVSFQLSFIATIGLVYITPLVSRWFGWIKSKGLLEIVSATVATNITVLPFVAYKMGIISLVSIPANILIAPLVPLAMLFGALSVFVFSIIPIVSLPLLSLSSLILSTISFVATKGSQAPVSHIVVPRFSLFVVIVWYIFMVIWWFIVTTKSHQKENEISSIIKPLQ